MNSAKITSTHLKISTGGVALVSTLDEERDGRERRNSEERKVHVIVAIARLQLNLNRWPTHLELRVGRTEL